MATSTAVVRSAAVPGECKGYFMATSYHLSATSGTIRGTGARSDYPLLEEYGSAVRLATLSPKRLCSPHSVN